MSKNYSSKAVLHGDWGLYRRKSTDEKGKQIKSLEDQEKEGRTQFDKLSPEEKVGRKLIEYPQESKTAFHPNRRKIFSAMIEDIRLEKLYGLIASDFRRISRNPEETGEFVQLMKDGKLKCFVSSVRNRLYWWNNSDDIAALMLEGGISCKDSMDKGDVIVSRMKARGIEGKHLSRKPFGFKRHIIPHTDGYFERITIVDEDQLPHLKKMFEMAARGCSLETITQWAFKNGIRARPAKNNRSGILHKATIAKILHNPFYKGYARYKGQEYAWGEEHIPRVLMPNGELIPLDEPPISPALWNRVQLMLASRRTNTARAKDLLLRKMFKFGSIIHCGKCNRVLSPYRVPKESGMTYVYYECKKTQPRCQVCVSQGSLEKQHKEKLKQADPGETELDRARSELVKIHREKSSSRKLRRSELQTKYEKIERSINDQVAALPTLKAIGLEENGIQQLKALKQERDTIKEQLDKVHDEGSAWIEKVAGCFELLKAAEEMLKYGSPRVREQVLKSIASNYKFIDGKLVPDLRSPFKEALERSDRPDWWR